MSSAFFNSFAVLFVAIDAAGIGPLFLLLTEGATREQRFKIAIKASVISFIVLIIFAYGGKFFFNWIGVSIDSLKIAGGIILFIISIEMLLDKRRLRREESANKVLHEKTLEEIAIFPLAIPLIAGPAAGLRPPRSPRSGKHLQPVSSRGGDPNYLALRELLPVPGATASRPSSVTITTTTSGSLGTSARWVPHFPDRFLAVRGRVCL